MFDSSENQIGRNINPYVLNPPKAFRRRSSASPRGTTGRGILQIGGMIFLGALGATLLELSDQIGPREYPNYEPVHRSVQKAPNINDINEEDVPLLVNQGGIDLTSLDGKIVRFGGVHAEYLGIAPFYQDNKSEQVVPYYSVWFRGFKILR